MSEQERRVRLIVDHLAGKQDRMPETWHEWQIEPIVGGRNNLLYRATSPAADLAVKFVVADGRDRAGHEYGALSALQQAGLSVAPEPLLLDRDNYAQAVVVQTWLEGRVSAAPPAGKAEWQALARHLAGVHSVTPDRTAVRLASCSIDARAVEDCGRIIQEQLAHLPPGARPASLQAILRQFEASRLAPWPRPAATLCRLDNNIANYIWRPGAWASVDWEYSGWGDPAFDVANLVTHVAWRDVPASRWEWFIDLYCDLARDPSLRARIQVYCQVLLVWWVVRLARYLYQIPLGQDARLIAWPAGWQADIQAKYEHYVRLANAG